MSTITESEHYIGFEGQSCKISTKIYLSFFNQVF